MTKQFLDELRKGNLIEWQHDLKNNLWMHSRVKEILDEHVVFVNGEKVHYSRVRPWVLTEKILGSYGFVKFKLLDPDCRGNNFCYRLSDVFSIRYDFSIQIWNGLTVKIKYVYQLQNLYQSLTGKELRFLNDKED